MIKVMHHVFVASGVVTNDAQFGTSSTWHFIDFQVNIKKSEEYVS